MSQKAETLSRKKLIAALEIADSRFQSFFHAVNFGIAVYTSTDGINFTISDINPAGAAISNISREDVLGREVREAFPGVVRMGLYDVLCRVWAEGTTESLPTAHYSDGQISRWFENRVVKVSDQEIITVYDNISARKEAEEQLQQSESRFRSLFETMHEGFAFHEVICNTAGEVVDYRYLDINPAFEQLTGLKRKTTIGRTVRELLPDIEDEWIQTFGRVALTGKPAERENYVQGLNRYYRARAYSPERGKFAVVFEEITAQKLAQQALEHRESQLRVLFDSSHAGIILVAPDGRIVIANQRMADMFGYSMQELTGLTYPELVHPDEREAGDERMRMLINRESSFVSTERHYIRRDGSGFWGFLSGRRHEDADGRLLSLVGHITDITDRKRAENSLRVSEERFRSIMALSPDIISIISKDGALLYNSPSALRIHGYQQEELIGLNTFTLIHPDDHENVNKAFQKVIDSPDQAVTVQYRYLNKDGSYVWMECSAINHLANPLVNGIIAISRDIGERKKLEEERLRLEQQLLHAQKLESLGVLAGGIAHDFNNILTAIIGNAELALMRLNPESPALDHLQRIEKSAARAADLARQMLAYSGKGKFIVEAIDLNRLVEEMGHMLEVSISKKALIRYDLNHSLPSIDVDATQIRQIVMNLVINASEAIGDKSGVISIATGCMECDRNYLKNIWLDENICEGLYVYLEVADTGCGMDRDTMEKIFDPFFTTKFTGRGLGMAAVLGIVRGHKGAIKVYSEPGKGSTFKVLLPAGGNPAELFDVTTGIEAWKGTGVALLVDDEETVRAIGAEMLKELGFEVVTANDGREALEIFSSRNDVNVVILDLTMPHMDGEQCFRQLRRLDPDVQVIMSSGFSEQEVTQKFSGKGLTGFIQKPYKLSDLKEILRLVVQNASGKQEP